MLVKGENYKPSTPTFFLTRKENLLHRKEFKNKSLSWINWQDIEIAKYWLSILKFNVSQDLRNNYVEENARKSFFAQNAATRADGTLNLSVSMHLAGKQVHAWKAFLNADEVEVSNSVYLGSITISWSTCKNEFALHPHLRSGACGFFVL